MWTVIVGAGSMAVASQTLDMWIRSDPLSLDGLVNTALVDAWGCAVGLRVCCRACLPRHTLAKCHVALSTSQGTCFTHPAFLIIKLV